jgi:CHASE2 domain-containing sensor protein
MLLEVIEQVVFWTWAIIAGYFIQRFVMRTRLVSLCIAVMALGWGMVGLGAAEGLRDLRPVVDMMALLVGVIMVWAIVAVEISSR